MQIETLKWLARHLPGKTIVWDVPGHLIVQAMKMEKARVRSTGRKEVIVSQSTGGARV